MPKFCSKSPEPGRSIDPAVIAVFIAELYQRYTVPGLAYRWRCDELLREFDRAGLAAHRVTESGDGLRLFPWGQGFRDMAAAIDALEVAIMERKLVHANIRILNCRQRRRDYGSGRQ